jgi:TM2 domain-containing membrane protein YozV
VAAEETLSMNLPSKGMGAGKRPIVALLLSVVFPGLGQLYNGEIAKGIVIAAACSILAAGVTWLGGTGRVSAAISLFVVWISAILDAYKSARASGHSLDWYYRVPYVVTMLLLVGPLALPLLWSSPYFSRRAQWLWTAVILSSLLLFAATPYLLPSLGLKVSGS